MSYTIFMKYNPEQPNKVSKYNKDMIEFFNKNIDQINNTGTEVRLVLIDEDDNQILKELSRKGISKVPALLGRNIKEPIQKIDKIKKFLMNNIKNRKAVPKKQGDEELRDYQLDLLDPTNDEPDDDENGDNNQRTSHINARLEFEKRRRDSRNPKANAMSAADIIAQQKRSRGRGLMGHRKIEKPAPRNDPDDDDDDNEDDAPKQRRGRRAPRGNNMADDPAALMANERARNQEEAQDNDLMSKFWAGRGVGTE